MRFSISSRGAATLIACAALPLSVAACSPSSLNSGGSSSTDSHATTATSAASATTDPDAGLPTGTQLKADLVSKGIPAGYALDSSGSVDTGSTYQPPTAPTSATGCTNLDGTSWVNLAGRGSVSFAQNDYIDNATTSEEFTQEIDAFQGTTAQDVMTALSDITAKCPTFEDSATSSTVKVSVATSS